MSLSQTLAPQLTTRHLMRLWGLRPGSRPPDVSGDCGSAGPCMLTAPSLPHGAAHPARPRVYRIRVKRLSTDTDSWEQGT